MADQKNESLHKLWAVIRREYLERVRTKWFIIGTVLGPLLLGLVVVLPVLVTRHDERQTANRVEIIDATGTGLGRYVAQSIGAADGAERQGTTIADVQTVAPGALADARTNATRDVTERLATGFLVLDSTTLHGDSVYYAGRRADSRGELTRIGDGVRAGLIALELQHRGIAASAVDSVITIPAPALRTETINDAGRSSASVAKSLLAGIVAFFLYMSIVLYGQSMLSGVIEEKMSRVAEIVISSVSPDILLAGKVIGVTAVGLTQQVIWVVGSVLMVAARGYLFPGATKAAAAASGGLSSGAFLDAAIAIPWSWIIAVLLFFVLGFLFYGALYAAVGATVGSEQDARQAAQPVVLLLVLTAVFISPVLQNPGSKLARTMSLLPFSSPIIMPLRMATVDVSPWEVAASIGILILGCAAAIWLAARIYRVGLLMYGKRPSLGELRRWIASA